MSSEWIVPDWPAPHRVRSLSTTRHGGFSEGPWRSFNLGLHSGDDPAAVERNRARLRSALPASPAWLQQVHGVHVVNDDEALPDGPLPEADARVSRVPERVCAILTADCLPVLFCDESGREVAAAHAGWRGLAGGVLERTVGSMAAAPESLLAWLGPAIGPDAYEVGDEVRAAFARHEADGAGAFRPSGPRWRLDLCAMARHCLARAGVRRVWGGGWCTHRDSDRFFSFRRDGACGRMATLVWLEPEQD